MNTKKIDWEDIGFYAGLLLAIVGAASAIVAYAWQA